MPSSPKKKPLVIVTRTLPSAIETRLMELFDTRLNADDKDNFAGDLRDGVLQRTSQSTVFQDAIEEESLRCR